MTGPSLVFASAAGGSAFMEELLEVVAEAVRDVGGRASTHVGPLPDADQDTVYVVVPHEFLVVTPPEQRPSADQLRRTIGFCVEHPGTSTFETSAALVGQLGGAFDINDDSTAELNRRGHKVQRYVLGYTRRWDAWGGDLDQPRDIDVTYLGTAERRRSRVLANAVSALDGFAVRLLTPPHEPMVRPRPDFLMGAAKHTHLARSRVLINLHREAAKALEWVRVLESVINGCVVVTEPSRDVLPFHAGRQLIVAAEHLVGDVTAGLLLEGELERRVRAEAYRFVREELDMADSARRLLEMAADLVERMPTPASRELVPAPVVQPDEQPMAIDTASFDPATDPMRAGHEASREARVAADAMVERATAAQRSSGLTFLPATVPLGPVSAQRVEDIDVLIVRKPSDPSVAPLIDDLALGTVLPGRVLVCEDGGHDSGARHYDQLVNPVVAGVGWSRDQLLERSTAAFVLVLSAGMRCTPELVEKLSHAKADVAHCPVGDVIAGMVGALPVEARRLAVTPYLGAGYLVRRELVERLGRWSADPWCDGLEDHLFWQAVAASGCSTELVQHTLLSRTGPAGGPRPIDLDPARAWAASRSAG